MSLSKTNPDSRMYNIYTYIPSYYMFQTAAGATWTETIKNTASTPALVDASVALSNFKTWMNSASGGGDLTAHDHAMLFTRQVCVPSTVVVSKPYMWLPSWKTDQPQFGLCKWEVTYFSAIFSLKS